jgi:hypothetical protein
MSTVKRKWGDPYNADTYEPPASQRCITCACCIAKRCHRYPVEANLPHTKWCGEWRPRSVVQVEIVPDGPPQPAPPPRDACTDCLRYSFCYDSNKGNRRCLLFLEAPKLPELPLVW